MKNLKVCWLVLVIALLLSGCAVKHDLPRFVWPAPPDEPRLEFAGNFYSERDFTKTRGQEMVRAFLGEQPEIIFKTPFGIVSDGEGRVYISDIHTHNVWVFDFNERTADTISKASLFQSPAGMALDVAGNLYVADVDKGRIVKYAGGRKYDSTIEFEGMDRPAYLAISPDGTRLYVSEPTKHRVLIFDAKTGEFIKQFGKLGLGDGEFNHPQGLAFGPGHRLFVVDSLNARIQSFDADGHFLSSFGSRGDQLWQLESPKDLAFDSEGNLHVIETRSSVVKTFTAEGRLLLVTGEGRASFSPFGFSGPKSIYIDPADRIYVSESLGKRFTVWQYMSKAYKERNPFTVADRQRLMEYIEDVAAGRK